jgi:hypothetical protein
MLLLQEKNHQASYIVTKAQSAITSLRPQPSDLSAIVFSMESRNDISHDGNKQRSFASLPAEAAWPE